MKCCWPQSHYHKVESQESVFHLQLTLHKTMSQGITVAANPERGVGNDPEPLGVAFLQGPSFTLMISLTCPKE